MKKNGGFFAICMVGVAQPERGSTVLAEFRF